MGKFDALKLKIKGRLQYFTEGYETPLEPYGLDEIKDKYAHCKPDVWGTKSAVVGTNKFYPFKYDSEGEGNYTFPRIPVTRENWKFMYRLRRISESVPENGELYTFRALVINQLSLNYEVTHYQNRPNSESRITQVTHCVDEELDGTLSRWEDHLNAARYNYVYGNNACLSTFCCP